MKLKKIFFAIIAVLSATLIALAGCGGKSEYILDESSFFLVMTNMQYYPQQYDGKDIEYDCFTYELTDVNGAKYLCGVRQCSSGYGCTCGNDTIIGFILEKNSDATSAISFPAPKNQSDNTNDKSWIHLRGRIKNSDKTGITVYAYANGQPTSQTETIEFLTFTVEKCDIIEDYSHLNHYVTT